MIFQAFGETKGWTSLFFANKLPWRVHYLYTGRCFPVLNLGYSSVCIIIHKQQHAQALEAGGEGSLYLK